MQQQEDFGLALPGQPLGPSATPSGSLRGIADFSHRMGKALPSLPEQHDVNEDMGWQDAPPPTPGLGSFASQSVYGSRAAVASSSRTGSGACRALSLVIPQNASASTGAACSPLPRKAWPEVGSDGAHIDNGQAPMMSSSLASKTKAGRKRPSKLTLVPPSAYNEGNPSSRSVPTSPAISARPPPQLRERGGALNSLPSASRDLSSTLRGTPRRRPSMPFQIQTKQPAPEHEYQDPGSSKRPPEAFRDPSEHILSGKGSTLQHARSVYSQGPVEILPGLFLGDEHNARDNEMLSDLGITTVLNVAKETVLPFQLDSNTSPLVVKPPSNWTDSTSSGTLTRRKDAVARLRKESDDFYTPPTTAYPSAAELEASSEQSSRLQASQHGDGGDPAVTSPQADTQPTSSVPASVSYLRNTASTPNLLSSFKSFRPSAPIADIEPEVSSTETDYVQHRPDEHRRITESDFYRYCNNQRRGSSESSDDAYDAASSPSSRADTCASSATELTPPAPNSSGSGPAVSKPHSSEPGATPSAFTASTKQYGEPRADITSVELPLNATALKIPASPISARMSDLRYIKLPWTHDETDLAVPGGGFSHGCAIIAEALGIDPRVWDPSTVATDTSVLPLLFQGDRVDKLQSSPHKGKVLVHCQCGVSRSATLVIAFVMQAAALRYGFEESRSLMGMHDCYGMVKEKSASISPNISLIYQLVEWERLLSKAASKLREALGGATPEAALSHSPNGDTAEQRNSGGNPGWSVEVLDEEKWSQMRLQEEQKEAEEEQRRREERLAEAKRATAERKAASDRLEGKSPITDASGSTDSAFSGGSLMQRRRKTAPALNLVGVGSSAKAAKTRPPMLKLASHTGNANVLPPLETPFLTAKTNTWRSGEHSRSDSESEVEQGASGIEDIVMVSDEASAAPTASSYSRSMSTPEPAVAGEDMDADTFSTPRLGGLATPVRPQHSTNVAKSPGPQSARPSSMSGLPLSNADSSRRDSVPMVTSMSLSGGRSRFSFGGIAAAFTPSGKRRPGSMAARPDGSVSSGLFGAAAQTKEERRKQHRRTFSSDLPGLRSGLDFEKLLIPSRSTSAVVPATQTTPDVDMAGRA